MCRKRSRRRTFLCAALPAPQSLLHDAMQRRLPACHAGAMPVAVFATLPGIATFRVNRRCIAMEGEVTSLQHSLHSTLRITLSTMHTYTMPVWYRACIDRSHPNICTISIQSMDKVCCTDSMDIANKQSNNLTGFCNVAIIAGIFEYRVKSGLQ
jgi:hypothetical protein